MTDEETAAAVRGIAAYEHAIETLKRLRKELEKKLTTELVMRDVKTLSGPWGSFEHPWRDGRVAWQRIAEELFEDSEQRPGHDKIPKPTIERHRGSPWREVRLYLKKED